MIRISFACCLLAAAAVGVSSCSSSSSSVPVAPTAEAQSILAKTDWLKSKTIDVMLSSYAFTPQDFTLEKGQPYKLRLINTSGATHTFSSDDLFSAVAVEKVDRAGVETVGITKDGVSLEPDEQAEIYLVPLTPGTYRIYCEKFLHETMGMHGTVTIQ